MLEVRNLTRRYGRFTAVENVNFQLRPYQVCGYLGPNGSGKSTTIKMLTGMIPPTSGEVYYRGRNIQEDLVKWKSVLGYVPEEPHLYSYLTGYEYLQLVGDLRCLPATLLANKIDGLLRHFSLETAKYDPISSYSKGMKQKILISAALLHNPEVFIFDEPLSGLDITAGLIFRSLMTQLAAAGKIVLCSSHELALIEVVCSDVVILSKGRVVLNSSIGELRGLRKMQSLESVFAEVAVHDDVEAVAKSIARLTVKA